MKSIPALALTALLILSGITPAHAQDDAAPLLATLENGMHVVVIANHLAPVVTTSLLYDVGSYDDTIPGIAHATEHMMFRGTTDLSSDQFATIATRIGAEYDAETTTTYTQYYFTIPASYLDVVLRIEADRMQHAAMRESDWENERGAIEQEVNAHLSNPVLKAIQPINQAFFGDSSWGKDPVGTIAGFQKMHAADIAAFYHTWYHPSNATLVIVGDVDPQAALASVKTWFGGIPAAAVPAHPPLPLAPLVAKTLDERVDFPLPFSLVAMRVPGTDDPDYAATQVLFAALNSQRAALADLMLQGKALAALAVANASPGGGIATFVSLGLPGTDPKNGIADLHAIIAGYAKTGLPSDVVLDAKQGLLSSSAYEAASIPGQAQEWTSSQAVEGRTPAQTYAALASVTPDDVNRAFLKYIANGTAVDAALQANPQAAMANAAALAGGKENVQVTASDVVTLPAWTTQYFSAPLRAPRIDDRATIVRLSNGMTIAMQHEGTSPTFTVTGLVRSNADRYEPKGREGVAQIAASLLLFGTTTYDYKAYRAQLEAIAARVQLGTQMSAQARAQDFDRTIDLLADGELHPAFPPDRFALVQSDSVKAARALEDRPEEKAAIARLNALYPPGDPHRRHATSKSLAAVTLADVKRWYGFAYRPDLVTFAVVGDVTPQDVKTTFEKYFGAWKAHGPTPPMNYPPIRKSNHAPKSVTIASTTAKQAQVTLTQTLRVRRGEADAVALDVANTMLSGEGTGSMLFRDVRKNHGYVYSIDSSLDVSDTGATFALTFASDPKNVDRAQSVAAATIERLRRVPPSAADLALAKAMLLSSYTVSLDSYDGIAQDLLDATEDGIDANDLGRYYAQVLATTPKDVQRAMQRWIDPARFTRVIVAPSQSGSR